jgi:hypothetical protein
MNVSDDDENDRKKMKVEIEKIKGSTFFKKDQTVKVNKINKVYDGPFLKLIHHRHLELKVNCRDLFGKRRKKWGI